MKRFRDPHWGLILLFLCIVAGVPLIQTLKEIPQENGVQALELFSRPPTAANLRQFEKDLESDNWAARLSRPPLQFARFAWLQDGGDKVGVGTHGWYFYKPGLMHMLARPELAEPVSGTNDPVAAIVHFRDQLAARGVRLLLMPVPNKESIYPDRVSSRAENLRGVLSPRTRELLDKLHSAGVEVIDLFKEFGETRQRKDAGSHEPLYLAQDTHWSPAGVGLAAKTVARRLLALGWVQPGQTEYTTRAAPVQRLGDIVRMLQAPMIERRVKPESVSCVQVVRCDNDEVYADGADAQILVLGDSFMRIYQQDQPGAAGFIAHLAKELKQPMMSLVNDGGGSTLVREELRAQPAFLKNKKVVIWEFVERDIALGVKGWQFINLPPPPPFVSSNCRYELLDQLV